MLEQIYKPIVGRNRFSLGTLLYTCTATRASIEIVVSVECCCDGDYADHKRWEKGDIEKEVRAKITSCSNRGICNYTGQRPSLCRKESTIVGPSGKPR